MTNEHTIEIKMRTPLWTGGVDGKCDRLHETGIIGSMR
ncbi:MAG: type III-B CRISPR module RAMP protein Cmr1, partial [Candidatus Aquicultor secundus]